MDLLLISGFPGKIYTYFIKIYTFFIIVIKMFHLKLSVFDEISVFERYFEDFIVFILISLYFFHF